MSSLAREYGFLLVVDDTISTFANTDMLHSTSVRVDLIVSSLTKLFSGVGNVMGGSLVLNTMPGHQRTPLLEEIVMEGMVEGNDLPILHYKDALTLELNSRDFLRRSNQINATAIGLATWFHLHSAVEHVYFPTVVDKTRDSTSLTSYNAVKRETIVMPTPNPTTGNPTTATEGVAALEHVSGYGCLMSIILRPGLNERAFYDSLNVRKGPSLGTTFTLCCPYTLLAHYNEMQWCEEFGVSERIIRISVGLESLEDLKVVFNTAFESCLHSECSSKL